MKTYITILKQTVIILIITITTSVFDAKAQWGPFSSNTVHLIGLDYSGSVNDIQRVYQMQMIDKIIDGMEKGEELQIVPIHRNTATALPLYMFKMETRYKGRRGKIAVQKKKDEVREELKSYLDYKKGKEVNSTDIIGLFRRAAQIKANDLKIYIYSDMIQYSEETVMETVYENKVDIDLSHVSEVKVIIIADHSGNYTSMENERLKEWWKTVLKSLGTRLSHWDVTM